MASSIKTCISWAAASRAARPPGSSRRPACPWCCTRCGRCAAPRRTRPTGWPSWSAPTPSAPTMPQNNAVGLLHEEMRRAGSLIMRAADAHKLPAGGALAVDRDGFSAAVQAALLAHPLVTLQREEVAGLPPADWDSVIVATGPLTSPALAEAIAQADRRGVARLLRRHRADRASREHRSVDRLEPVALRQGGPGRRRRGLHQLPARQGRSTRPSSTRLLAGEKTEFKEWEASTPYFEGCLPIEVMAARGPQTPALRADEAGRPDRSAHRPAALGGRAAAPGQCARHAVEHGGLPDQAEARRAGRACSARSPACRTPSSRGWAACIATPSSTARACSTRRLRLKALPRLRFAGQITGCEGYVESAAVGLLAGRFAAAELLRRDAERAAGDDGDGRAARPHHRRRRRRRPSSR